jgi:hypothetical protein
MDIENDASSSPCESTNPHYMNARVETITCQIKNNPLTFALILTLAIIVIAFSIYVIINYEMIYKYIINIYSDTESFAGDNGLSLSHPATYIDINNDGNKYLFIGSNVSDKLLMYKGGKYHNIIANTGLSSNFKTYSVINMDLDNDGYADLIVGRENGLFVYFNNKDGTFTSKKIIDTQPMRMMIESGGVSEEAGGSMTTESKKLSTSALNAIEKNDPIGDAPFIYDNNSNITGIPISKILLKNTGGVKIIK